MVRVRDLRSSTPLRLSLAMAGLFALVSLVSLGVTYAIVRDNAVQALRSTLEQDVAGFQTMPSAAAVADAMRAQARVVSPEDRILSYVLPDGTRVGNARPTASGESFVPMDNEEDVEDAYVVSTVTLHGGEMILAINTEPLDDLREAFIAVLIFTLVPTGVLVVGGGLLLARRSARRLARIDQTLDRLSAGDYDARVGPVAGPEDDLSRIGARIDAMASSQAMHISALKQVSADIAHDLKTPIQRVAVLLHRLRDDADLDDEAAALVDRADTETDGIVKTFQSLLQIAQIEGGSPKQRFEPVNIAALARTFCEVYEPAADESGHTLSCAVSGRSVFVRGDRTLLGQVYANLIENALRHAPPGSAITVKVGGRGAVARVTVADNGPGIPASERENVLRRLYRLERSRTTPGSGLGLSLVSAIVRMHDGTLALEDNDPGLRVAIEFREIGDHDHGA